MMTEDSFPHSGQSELSARRGLPIAREGYPFIIGSTILTALVAVFGLYGLALFLLGLTAFVCFFFRDPERSTDAPDNAVLTPADGKVIQILQIDHNDNPLGEPAFKISIFMSIFNVHVNRIPITGVIKDISYHPGKFFSANLDKASEENERNAIKLQTTDSRNIVFIQIAGLIARRIACWVEKGDNMRQGQRFGLIRYGSRLEVYIPDDSQITARLHQKVSAGKTVIGYLS